ncbi:MAG: preprotein translocase subunit SecE [Planctomycetes bacterium]|nr:preprotein translocase subunit SecE [Planctomycetota bacterium]
MKYKPDQGTFARGTGLWLVGALWAYGCYSLYYYLLSTGGPEGNGFLARPLTDGDLPVLGTPLTVALLVAIGAGLAGLLFILRTLDKPKIADMLIDSEVEMRKCTWPSWNETFSSSVVILVVMLFFTAVLAGMDLLLATIMEDYVF